MMFNIEVVARVQDRHGQPFGIHAEETIQTRRIKENDKTRSNHPFQCLRLSIFILGPMYHSALKH